MRTVEDAYRSMKRYAAQVLGEGWEVRLSREEGAFRFPFCRVAMAGDFAMTGPAHTTDMVVPMVWNCYPEPSEEPDAGMLAATDTVEAIYQGFRVGVDQGRPMRVPLYDYDGVDLTAGADTRGYCDYMRVNDLSVTTVTDPEDNRRVSVNVDVRVTWRRPGRRPSDHSTVRDVVVQPADPPDTNLCPDPSFEEGLWVPYYAGTEWTPDWAAATLGFDTDWAFEGTKSAHVTGTKAANTFEVGLGFYSPPDRLIEVVPGARYRLTVQVHALDLSGMSYTWCGGYWLDSGQQAIQPNDGWWGDDFGLSNGDLTFVHEAVAPTGAAFTSLDFGTASGTSGATVDVAWDAVVLERVA